MVGRRENSTLRAAFGIPSAARYMIRADPGGYPLRAVARRSTIFLGLGLLVGTACPIGRTPIRDILDHPRAYHGKKVTVAGEVTRGVNLLVVRYFIVRDATGEIPVVTQGAVPRPGERVWVTGVVNQAFVLGDQSLVVLIETGD